MARLLAVTVTVIPVLIVTLSPAPGTCPQVQVPGVSQSQVVLAVQEAAFAYIILTSSRPKQIIFFTQFNWLTVLHFNISDIRFTTMLPLDGLYRPEHGKFWGTRIKH